MLYNEVPDRVADSLFLVALGYAIGMPWLGWLAALAAAVTAYIRVLGGTFGLAQDFRGPLAKQHRMAVDDRGLPARHRRVLLWTAARGIAASSRGLDHRRRRHRHLRHAHPRDRAAAEGALMMRPSSALLVGVVKLLVGAYARWVGTAPAPTQRIYFANHTSHIDTLAIWSSLPRALRRAHASHRRARLLGQGLAQVHRDARVRRRAHRPRARERRRRDPLEPLRAALREGDSLIIFPEGTRGTSAVPARIPQRPVPARRRISGRRARAGVSRQPAPQPAEGRAAAGADGVHRALRRAAGAARRARAKERSSRARATR